MALLNFRQAKVYLPSNKISQRVKLALLIAGLLLSILYMLFFVPRSAGQTRPSVAVKELIALTNAERVKNNLPPLITSRELNQAAQQKTGAIFKWQKFSHDLPGLKFSDSVKAAGYEYAITGENLAEGFASAEAIIKAWMKSQSHRENILNPKYKEIGLSVKKDKLDGRDTYVVVQYFGSRLNPLIILSENFRPNYSLLKTSGMALGS